MEIKMLTTGVVTIISDKGHVSVFTEKQYRNLKEAEIWWIKTKDKLFK